MFIELTISESFRKVLININKIDEVISYRGLTSVLMNGNEYIFEESYDQVKDLIKREVAAERGY